MVGSVSGFVEHMNLRITQLRDTEGRLITVPNSMINIVQNLSKDWSRVDLFIDVAYSANPEEALAVVEQVATELYRDRTWSKEILEPPDVLGIENLTHTGMTIRTWIKTVPLSQWTVSREFRRRLKLRLDEAEIGIGIPQQMVTAHNGAVYAAQDDSMLLTPQLESDSVIITNRIDGDSP
jgi:moderate conductance mechanosensitive channel